MRFFAVFGLLGPVSGPRAFRNGSVAKDYPWGDTPQAAPEFGGRISTDVANLSAGTPGWGSLHDIETAGVASPAAPWKFDARAGAELHGERFARAHWGVPCGAIFEDIDQTRGEQ